MAPCPILAALCVGIEEYSCQGLCNLPGARRDAQHFAEFLRGRKLPEERLYLLLGRVTKGELETAIGQFMHLIKSDRPKPSTCHVVVVFMAAHGRQPHTSEVPAILPSDVRFPEREEELVNLDPLLLVPLDSIKSEKLKVWLTIDACRENQEIVTWTGNQQSQLQRVHRRSETDFHILLACDRGRFANDAYSLADVLIEALDDPWKDVETASKEAQNRIEQLSYGKQRPWRNSRGDFSGILLPEPNIEALCMPLMLVKWLMLAAGVLAAILVIFIFWLLLQSIDMGCTVQSSRHGVGCPEDSCFCTDCDLCKIYLDERHWQEFSCQMLGLPLNRCRLTLLANAGWLVATSKLGWQTFRKCGRDPGQLLLVVVPCVLSATSAVPLWQIYVSLSWKVFTVAVMYNVINTCLLASSMSIVLRLASLQQKQRCCGRAFDMLSRQFLRSFLPAAMLGEFCVMLLTKSTKSFEEFFEQENKFYLLYLMLGLLLSWIAWRLVCGISAKYNRDLRLKMKRVVWYLLIGKIVWSVFRCLHWLGICHHFTTLTSKYNLVIVQM